MVSNILPSLSSGELGLVVGLLNEGGDVVWAVIDGDGGLHQSSQVFSDNLGVLLMRQARY